MRPDTPYLLVDDDVVRSNVQRLADRAAELGLQVRPHAKTHKCAQVADLQLASGATGLSVATIGEAEAFAAAGVTDLFIAYPLWLTEPKATRLRTLAHALRATPSLVEPPPTSLVEPVTNEVSGGVETTPPSIVEPGRGASRGPCRNALRLAVDSPDGARQLARGLRSAPVDVLIEIDSGMHRSGVAPARAGEVAAAARDAGLRVIGVFTFPGHGYSPGEARQSAARQESAALAEAAESLRTIGLEPEVISGGSTPTVDFADPGVLTEIRPGVYPFNDAQQWELGSCTPDQIALVAMSTVVSIAPPPAPTSLPEPPMLPMLPELVEGSRVILDAGSKTLGADRPAWTTGFGRLLDYPDARIVALSEHHATAEFPPGTPPPTLGEVVRVVPNHVCTAVNLADELTVTTARGLATWPLIARGANT